VIYAYERSPAKCSPCVIFANISAVPYIFMYYFDKHINLSLWSFVFLCQNFIKLGLHDLHLGIVSYSIRCLVLQQRFVRGIRCLSKPCKNSTNWSTMDDFSASWQNWVQFEL